MTDPRNLSIKDFVYSLPEERIARYPLPERDASKLLILKHGKISDDIYRNISAHIPGNSLLIFNDTRVIEARLLFQKPTGGIIEIFCLEPHEKYTDITNAMLQHENVLWHCLVGGASKWKKGQVLEKKIQQGDTEVILRAAYCEKIEDSFIISLSWAPAELSFAEVLHCAGAMPLPPYIKRKAEKSDSERYQTVYAQADGSVAAPTAGLHFTDLIFKQFKEKNIETGFVTLHAGAGTFKPVKSNILQEHAMHAEWIDVSRTMIRNISDHLEHGIIAVGTTSLRTIESLYWLGVKKSKVINRKPGTGNREPEELGQWEAYELAHHNIPVKVAMQSLLDWMDTNRLDRLVTRTQILIAPGYPFKIVKGLITNFHQPRSTLLLLIAAFTDYDPKSGQANWEKIYQYALENEFRFLSYGDGCLLWKQNDIVD